MIVIEGLQLLVLSVVCIYSSITDLKRSTIPNRILLPALILSVLLSSIYYLFFANDLWLVYFLNAAIISIISILLYVLHIWGGGDSKLLILLALGTPARFYYYANNETIPFLNMIIWSFSFGFIYLLLESGVLTVLKKPYTKRKFTLKDATIFITNFFIATLYLMLVNQALSYFLPSFLENNASLLMLFEAFLIMLVFEYEMLRNKYLLICIGVLAGILCMLNGLQFSVNSITIYAVVILIYLLRRLIERYNYKVIEIDKLRPGMIISAASSIQFLSSKITGLPTGITEDLRSKLTVEQIDAIKKWWSTSAKSSSSITIVNKMPFAIFITLGFFLFIVLGGSHEFLFS